MPFTEEALKSVKALTDDYKHNNFWLRATVIIASALTIVGVLITILLIIQNQQAIKSQVQETKRQGVVNQKYIRCIVLIPREVYQNPDAAARANVVDNCAEQSRLP